MRGRAKRRIDVPYKNWYVNMIFVSGATALLSVFFGVIAAYAFARFRFKGRRMGMLSLLLIQMFPTFLAVVAIYLIVLRVGDIFPAVGLDTRVGLILVYLGGVLGVNTWLMKGFLDSIPDSLDESARVDGATPAQVFWAVILPLAAPVLAVVGLISYIFSINEYIIASVLIDSTDKFTMTVGSVQLHQRQVRAAVGDVLRRRDPRRDPRRHPLLLPPALLHRGRDRRREGLTRGRRPRTAAPRRLGGLRRPSRPAELGDETTVLLRVFRRRRGRRGDPALRARRGAAGTPCRDRSRDRLGRRGGARLSRRGNPGTPYRWLLSGGDYGYAWLNALGVQSFDVPDADDFIATPGAGGPDWHLESVVYQVFPDRFASSGREVAPPEWAIPREWDELPTGRGPKLRSSGSAAIFAESRSVSTT